MNTTLGRRGRCSNRKLLSPRADDRQANCRSSHLSTTGRESLQCWPAIRRAVVVVVVDVYVRQCPERGVGSRASETVAKNSNVGKTSARPWLGRVVQSEAQSACPFRPLTVTVLAESGRNKAAARSQHLAAQVHIKACETQTTKHRGAEQCHTRTVRNARDAE